MADDHLDTFFAIFLLVFHVDAGFRGMAITNNHTHTLPNIHPNGMRTT